LQPEVFEWPSETLREGVYMPPPLSKRRKEEVEVMNGTGSDFMKICQDRGVVAFLLKYKRSIMYKIYIKRLIKNN